ncbi:TRAP transporter small permease [Azospirillum sp.]|uniref:TRAP transporter small permease n=1 Tax=Azospirillum sp. TaxID=34012 RepID=UPI002D2B1C74|nr:TRAP transporter small permease [Azospirillum sp.]HYD66019.1 TRAP transporter small permease [Azospirillum sp.]
MSLRTVRTRFERLLDTIVVALVVGLALIVCAGFLFRAAGHSLVWYDEVAAIGLCWLTYYGSALAALKGAHIGCPEVVNLMPPRWRVAATVVAEACVFLFFGVLAWTGLEVWRILEGDTLVSLPSVPMQLTQSVIPIGAVLFMIAEALRLPQALAEARGAGFADAETKEAQMHAAANAANVNADANADRTTSHAVHGSAPR